MFKPFSILLINKYLINQQILYHNFVRIFVTAKDGIHNLYFIFYNYDNNIKTML
jgi:hypothetical protein